MRSLGFHITYLMGILSLVKLLPKIVAISVVPDIELFIINLEKLSLIVIATLLPSLFPPLPTPPKSCFHLTATASLA